MNKLLSKTMLFVVVLSMLLAACAPAATPAPATKAPEATKAPAAAEPTKAPAAATAAPAAAKTTDIELWIGASVSEAGAPPADWAAYSLMKEKAGANLKLVLLPSSLNDQDTKINAAAAANNLPDIFQVNRDAWYKLVNQGLIAPVDSLLPLMPERTKAHYSDPIRNKLVTVKGQMYGLAEPGALPRIDGLVIRKDWLDKLKLQTPKTLDELMVVAKAFTEKDPDGNGKNDTYGFGAYIEGTGLLNAGLGTRFDWVFGAYGVAGVWNMTDSASFGMNVRNPNYMKAVEYIKKMNEAKVIDPDWPTLKKDEFRARWKQGKYGIMHENFAALSTVANYTDFDKNFPDGEFVVLQPPTGPDGKSSSMGVDVASARIFAISKKALDAGKGPAIAKLLEWMNSDEGYFLLGFGQKDVNYKLDKDGNVTVEGIDPKLAYTAKEMQPLTQIRNIVFINKPVELKARYVAYKTKNGRAMDPLAYREAFNKSPYTDATGASIINPPSNSADFVRFYSENIVKFALGQKALDQKAWDEYVKGLDGLGAKDLEANAKKVLTEAGFLK